MINNKKIIAIITARGGSKSLKNKNIMILDGHPLVSWSIREAKKSKYIDKLILSTDDRKIIKIAENYGCEIPFKRPKYLSTDKTKTLDVIFHTLEKIKEKFDYVLLLQPTSPLRTVYDIDSAINECISKKRPSCVSVCNFEKSAYWLVDVTQKSIIPFYKKKHIRRQKTPKIYYYNGAIYFAEISWLKKKQDFVSTETLPYIMPFSRSVDIDSREDFKLAEYFMKDR